MTIPTAQSRDNTTSEDTVLPRGTLNQRSSWPWVLTCSMQLGNSQGIQICLLSFNCYCSVQGESLALQCTQSYARDQTFKYVQLEMLFQYKNQPIGSRWLRGLDIGPNKRQIFLEEQAGSMKFQHMHCPPLQSLKSGSVLDSLEPNKNNSSFHMRRGGGGSSELNSRWQRQPQSARRQSSVTSRQGELYEHVLASYCLPGWKTNTLLLPPSHYHLFQITLHASSMGKEGKRPPLVLTGSQRI